MTRAETLTVDVRVFLLAGEHGNRTHLPPLTRRNSGFEGRDGHQLRNLSLVDGELDYTLQCSVPQQQLSGFDPCFCVFL